MIPINTYNIVEIYKNKQAKVTSYLNIGMKGYSGYAELVKAFTKLVKTINPNATEKEVFDAHTNLCYHFGDSTIMLINGELMIPFELKNHNFTTVELMQEKG